MPVTLEGLPEAWLRQFVQQLPTHLKLQLRCCSRKLQGYVDELGVGVVARGSTVPVLALRMTAQHMTSLNTLQLDLNLGATTAAAALQGHAGVQGHAPDNSCQAALAEAIRQLPLGLPALRKLAVNPLQQPDLLAAVLGSRPPQLTHVRLCDRQQGVEFTPQQLQQRCEVLLRLSELAPALATLEVDFRTFRLAQGFIHTALQQPLPQLRALLLHPKLLCGHAADCSPVIPQHTWAAVFQPLLATLTRLEFGSRDMGLGATGEGAAEPAAAAGSAATAAAAASSQLASASQAEVAGGGGSRVSHLLQLRCSGLDGPADPSWSLSWVGGCSRLTALDISLCSAGELDCEVLAQLQQLQSLSLHHFPDEFVSADQLAPLSACCRLTQLKLEGLLVELPAAEPIAGAASAAAGSDVGLAAAAGGAGVGGPGPAAVAQGHVARASLMLPQLTSLQRLTAGLMCKAPLSTFTLNVTRLKDLDYDLALLDLPGSFISEQQPAALTGLTALQVLAVNIFALVRHAATPPNLFGLRELHVDMVGSMDGSCIDPGGLPCLPQLTKLVMSIDTKVHKNLPKTYSTSEDRLLWRNQSAVRHLRLRGSALLGGFLVEAGLLEQLPAAMPDLQRAEIVKAQDLTLQQLRRFVAARACRCVLVQGCGGVRDSDCIALQQLVNDVVAVEYGV